MPRREREQAILDAAGQVFASGYHGAAMDEIARLADVSKPMLYAYFGSKEGLYMAYVDRTGRELLDRLVGAGGGERSPTELLRSRILEFLAFVAEHRNGWRVLFGELNSSRPVAEQVAQLRSQIAEWITAMLEPSGDAEYALPPAAVDAIAHAIVGAGESLANWWLENPEVGREQVAEWYVGVVLGAAAAATRGADAAGRIRP
ncbi:MAG TPA: TetR/AcrR family transcriptional regulator [Solirubrobacteraceae bacterium]